MHKTIQTQLSSSVATGGTFTVGYPSGTTRGSFIGGVQHVLIAGQSKYVSPTDFTVSFGASSATITYNGATTLPAGTDVFVQFDMNGEGYLKAAGIDGVITTTLVKIDLGSPVASDDDGVSASAAVTAAAGATIGGALASSGVATFDVPRNVIITSAGNDSAKTFTVTGTDAYGNAVKESITGANAGVAAGVKAFKKVSAVAISADSASTVKIGCGDVLGLPVFLPNGAHVLKELENGAAATAGTLVAGLSPGTKSTATTADVRGTYDPNSACDGSKAFSLIVALPDPAHKGNPQYAG